MAGESAQRKYEQLRDKRREQLRKGWPLLLALAVIAVAGGAFAMHLLLGIWWPGALLGLLIIINLVIPAQREVAWRKGAEGEQAVGHALEQLKPSSRALHDLRIPGSRANIDHILIAPTGVWTVDAKNYTGKLETRHRGNELWVNGRDRSKLLDQARRQTDVVKELLAKEGLSAVPVRPALCFLGVEWPLLFRPKTAGDVALVSRRQLPRLAEGTTVIPRPMIERVTAALARSLQPALRPDVEQPRSATPPAPPSTPAPTALTDLTVNHWKRYGKSRLYVNDRGGHALGYVDLETNEVVPAEEHHRDTVREAAAAHLRQS